MKILVPTDFSKNADTAADYAIKIADKKGAEVTLLHACQIIKTELKPGWTLFEEYNKAVAVKLHDELKKVFEPITKTTLPEFFAFSF